MSSKLSISFTIVRNALAAAINRSICSSVASAGIFGFSTPTYLKAWSAYGKLEYGTIFVMTDFRVMRSTFFYFPPCLPPSLFPLPPPPFFPPPPPCPFYFCFYCCYSVAGGASSTSSSAATTAGSMTCLICSRSVVIESSVRLAAWLKGYSYLTAIRASSSNL